MSAIKSLCKKVKNSFTTALSENPLSAILMLGNLYVSLKHADADDRALITQTLVKLKGSLTEKQANRLWNTILSISPKRLGLMTSSNIKSFNKLKHEMICDADYFKHIESTSLVKGGQSIKFYRLILIALIRQNLLAHGLLDLFEQEKFDFDSLKEAGAEQSEYLAEFIKRCALPSIELLLALGQKSEIAQLMLLDIKDNNQIFEISAEFAQQHPSLREEIAENWRTYIETYSLTSKQDEFLANELPKLRKKFPEFNFVDLDSRIERNNQIEVPPADKSFYRVLFEGGFSGLASSVGISSGLAQLGFALSVPAYAVSLPVCVGMNLGLNWMFERSKTSIKAGGAKASTIQPERSKSNPKSKLVL